MYNELTNLLPIDRQSTLFHSYLLRLGVVSAVFLSMLTLASAVMLLPTYVFLVKSASAKETHLANIESVLSSANEKELSVRLVALSNDAATLTTLASAPAASAIIRTILAVSHPGIALSGFAYTLAAKKIPSTLTISGTAATRESLRSYQLTLQGASFARSATLPVSAYAKDINITFTITVILAP